MAVGERERHELQEALMESIRGELRGEMGELRGELHRALRVQFSWLVKLLGTLLAISVAILTTGTAG